MTYEIKDWFYNKINKERGLDMIWSWVAVQPKNTIARETEKAYLMNFKQVVYENDEVNVTPVQIWVPKSCVTVY